MPPLDGTYTIDLTCNGVPHRIHSWDVSASPVRLLALTTSDILNATRFFDGMMELRFSIHVLDENLQPCARSAVGVRCEGEGWDKFHYLGPMGGTASESALMILPSMLPDVLQLHTVTLSLDNSKAPEPAELLLAQHIQTIIENDECLGSMSVDNVQNRVFELPFYHVAMKNNGNLKPFTKFVRKFAISFAFWTLFQYTEEEIRAFGLPREYENKRITSISFYRTGWYIANDIAREHIKNRATGEICAQYSTLAQQQQLSHDQICSVLGDSRAYKTVREIHYDRILKQIADSGGWTVLFHPHHEVRIAHGTVDSYFARFKLTHRKP